MKLTYVLFLALLFLSIVFADMTISSEPGDGTFGGLGPDIVEDAPSDSNGDGNGGN
ncbi:unnamed protein product [Moneuplotes crassus]|uniref:Uncharacterized protein n=1 Tax=Euplotes crassus TaxID=5936 RepID=A0AAD1Y412_EUPCR|nr:unnamed protein product [Moneuplotes crassus]